MRILGSLKILLNGCFDFLYARIFNEGYSERRFTAKSNGKLLADARWRPLSTRNFRITSDFRPLN